MLVLGENARDTLTGFRGIVIGRTEYLHGCRQVLIQPRGLQENGQPEKAKWIDEPQVELAAPAGNALDGAPIATDAAVPGGPQEYEAPTP